MDPAEQNFLQLMIAKRMLELIDVRTPWHRSLWQLGTLKAVLEILECTNATWVGAVPNDKAQKYLIERCKQQISEDVGIGSEAVRTILTQKLSQLSGKKNSPGSPLQPLLEKEIGELSARAKRDYLRRWKEFVEAGLLTRANVERTARLVVTHLLDDGFDRRHIHGWLRATLAKTTDGVLLKVLDEGHAMCRQDAVQYRFAIPLQRGAKVVSFSDIHDLLILPEEIKSEFEGVASSPNRTHQFERLISQEVPLVIGKEFWARDPHAASARLLEWLQKVEARSQIGLGRNVLQFSREVLDRTDRKLRNIESIQTSLRVPALDRHGLYTDELNPQLDAALGLLGSHGNLSPVTSVATTWAAVEGLLGHPGAQGIDSADGLAAIVACSFPRAELEDLLDRDLTSDALIDGALENIDEVRGSERARLMLSAIQQHGTDIFEAIEDVAAAERILQLVADPAGVLTRVQGYFSDVFRRLYYQRNFVMHAAKFDSVSLPSTVMCAPKLVAAGVDRVVHAQYVRTPVEPLALAARARNEIQMLGKIGAREVFRLLK